MEGNLESGASVSSESPSMTELRQQVAVAAGDQNLRRVGGGSGGGGGGPVWGCRA